MSRLAFNSSWHVLSAQLVGMNILLVLACFGQSFLILLKAPSYPNTSVWVAGLSLLPGYLLLKNFNTDSPDLVVTLGLWMVAWQMLILEEKPSDLGHLSLFVLLVWLPTVKFSAFMTLALAAWLIWELRFKPWRLLGYTLVAASILVPWLMRNYYLSGYLIYPLASVDLFQPDWKMPRYILERELAHVKIGAITPWDLRIENAQLRFFQWFPEWFSRLGFSNLLLVLAQPLAFGYLIRRAQSFSVRYKVWLGIWLLATLYWFVEAPNFRFGYGYLFGTVMLAAALALAKIQQTPDWLRFSLWPRGLALAGLGLMLVQFWVLYPAATKPYAGQVLEYGEGENEPTERTEFYVTQKDGDFTHENFPVTNHLEKGLTLRGPGLKYGFRIDTTAPPLSPSVKMP